MCTEYANKADNIQLLSCKTTRIAQTSTYYASV